MAELLLILLYFLPVIYPIKSNPEVKVGSATYLGSNIITEYGQHCHAFLGIRYATSERFSRPQLISNITGTYNATDFGAVCVQSLYIQGIRRIEGEEDCLFLNIYIPKRHSSGKRAVIVWIHGGGFIYGSSRPYDSSVLATLGDVIVVTIQYRLGPFGFLSTKDDISPGNLGLWDQHTALRWINENIIDFGGNPNMITLMGVSAGGASVNYQALSPASKGLFHRAIMQSGAASCSWAFTLNPLPATYYLAKKMNCYPTGNNDERQLHKEIIECLKKVPFKKLYESSWPMSPQVQAGVFDFVFVPTVDNDFVLDNPHHLVYNIYSLQSTSLSHIDTMLSVNNNEGGNVFFLGKNLEKMLNMSLLPSVTTQFGFKHLLLSPLLKQIYGVSDPYVLETVFYETIYPESLLSETVSKKAILKLASDPTFVVPVYHWAKSISSLGGRGRTYVYHFDHVPSFIDQTHTQGMVHGMDKFYTFGVFKSGFLPGSDIPENTQISKHEKDLARSLIGFLSNFAKHGNPVPDYDQRLPNGWPEFNDNTELFLVLRPNLTIRDHLYRRRVSLWSELVPKLMSQNVLIKRYEQPEPVVFRTDIFQMRARTADMTVIGLAVALFCVIIICFIIIIVISRRGSQTLK